MASVALSRNRDFVLLWSGQALSSLGSQISQAAFPLLVLALTGSAAKAGIAGFARNLPMALLALPAGVLADRLNRKHLLIATDAVRAVCLGAIPITLLAGHLPYAVIVAAAAIDGGGNIITVIAERGVVPQLVSAEQLPDAVARNESRVFGAMVAGPPLGGALFAVARAVPFICDAVSYAFSSGTKLLISRDFQETRAEGERSDPREGIRWLWERPFFRMVSLLFAASNPVFTGVLLLGVLLAKQHGASSAAVGAMLGVAAIGGLVGALLAPRLQRRLSARFVLIGENVMLAGAIPLLLVAHNALLLGLVLALGVLITPVTNSIVVSYRTALAPDRLQGRIAAASMLISFSGTWAGPLLVGLLVQGAGTTATVLTLTGWAIALTAIAATTRSFRDPPGPRAQR